MGISATSLGCQPCPHVEGKCRRRVSSDDGSQDSSNADAGHPAGPMLPRLSEIQHFRNCGTAMRLPRALTAGTVGGSDPRLRELRRRGLLKDSCDSDESEADLGFVARTASANCNSHLARYFLRESPEVPRPIRDCEISQSYTFETGAVYTGQWCQGLRHGLGRTRWPDGAAYEGQWVEDAAHGQGEFRHADGGYYVGEWNGSVAHGLGIFRAAGLESAYAGEFRQDLREGFGVELNKDGFRYEGRFAKGKKHGHGTYMWPDGSCFSGEWCWDQMEGYGKYNCQDDAQLAGRWFDSELNGTGQCSWPDGRQYQGQYLDGRKDGFGSFVWPDGRKYQGFWRGGSQHGHGWLIMDSTSQQCTLNSSPSSRNDTARSASAVPAV